MFSRKDKAQIKSQGIKMETIQQQLKNFQQGFPDVQLAKAATPGDGITQIPEDQLGIYQQVFATKGQKLSLMKFVPASGAATRMFKTLYDFMNHYMESEEEYLEFLSKKGSGTMFNFFDKLEDFPFYQDLCQAVQRNGLEMEKLINKNQFKELLSILLSAKGLNYGNLPKGLLKFHRYKPTSRTAFDEHLTEALHYARNAKGTARIHLTVSPEHKKLFAKHLKSIRKEYENKHNGTLRVSFSIQKSSTDTLAVDMNNEPYRNEDNTLLFRPGGHGALIENLNELKADIVFIKNIDNVVPDRLKTQTYLYKEVLAGVLIQYQEKIFKYLNTLKKTSSISSDILEEIIIFTKEKLCILPPIDFSNKSQKDIIKYLTTILNRPIRVCGMVRNEGEPGGGPFWVKNDNGTISLQIVEAAQINLDDPQQKTIMEQSTHFNPVDLVCGLKNHTGKKFNLTDFVNKDAGFIAYKSQGGHELKAMELPGLWNGAMANWNTVFVEVPIVTFNPVKTIFDLLRIEHRN